MTQSVQTEIDEINSIKQTLNSSTTQHLGLVYCPLFKGSKYVLRDARHRRYQDVTYLRFHGTCLNVIYFMLVRNV